MSLACGVDVGGTKIAAGVVDEAGRVLEKLRVESPATDEAAIEDAIAGLVTELASRHVLAAVGVGAAGYVDGDRSRVLFAPNLAWRNVPLGAELQRRVTLPVVVENDANAAAWGEFCFGAGHDVDDLMLVTVGTGVGGGLVIGGELLRGAFGVAGEIGHVRVVPEGILCGCGQRGCFEQYASGTALVRDTRSAAAAGASGADHLVSLAGGDPTRIDGPMITSAAQAGDPFACERLAGLGRWLGEGIASLCAVIDPAVVAIGGGVAEAGELLLGPLREAFESHIPSGGYHPTAEVRLATVGTDAGLIGAADLARR